MNLRERLKVYEDLVNLNGTSGHEKKIREYMRKEISKYTDEIIQDRLGSIFGVKRGSGKPVIMIAGHMDEVGAMVTKITKEGFIKMISIGGIEPEVMVSQNVVIQTKTKEIKGVVGSIPPHMNRGSEEGKKQITFDDLFVDIGADSKEHAEEMGIEIGQQINFVNHYYITEDGKKIVSKAWDNRFGCGMALEVLKELKDMDHPNVVISGATVQEEVGLRGATTASQMVVPDLFIAIDVSPVGDFLKKDHPSAYGKLGEGFLARFYDPRNIMSPKILAYFEKLAKDNNIKMQHFLSRGGTDAAAAQYAGSGTIATTIGLPGRYIHSTAAMVHIDDIEAVKQMVLALIKDFDEKRLMELKHE